MELYATKEDLISAVTSVKVNEVNEMRKSVNNDSLLDTNWISNGLEEIQKMGLSEDDKTRFSDDVRSQLYNVHPEVDWKNIVVRQYD